MFFLAIGMSKAIQFTKTSKYFTPNFYKQVVAVFKYRKELSGFEMFYNHKDTLSVPVLLYHGIEKNSNRFTITPEVFKDHLFTLKKAGYQTITLEEFKDFIEGKIDLPEKSFLLTFDDGRKDSYYEADPVLESLGYNAVMFVAAGQSLTEKSLRSTYYLNKHELVEMQKTLRWSIQSHFVQESGGFVKITKKGDAANFLSNKQYLSNENRLENDQEYRNRITFEIEESKKIIQDKMNNSVIAASFPFGDYGQQSTNNLTNSKKIILAEAKANYNLLFFQVWPKPGIGLGDGYSYNYKNDSNQLVKRIEPSTSWSGKELMGILHIGEHKVLPYVSNASNSIGWINTWGYLDSSLRAASTGNTNGSFAFLDGSYGWVNYIYSIKIDWNKGSTFGLVARLIDNDNYASCVIDHNIIKIEERIEGKTNTLIKQKHNLLINTGNIFAIVADGKNIACYIGDKKAIESKISARLPNGGIGFRTWDGKKDNTFIQVKRIEVLPILGVANYLRTAQKYDVFISDIKNPTPIDSSFDFVNSSNENFDEYVPPVGYEPIKLSIDENRVPYETATYGFKGWKNSFGSFKQEEDEMYIGSNASTTSSLVTLQGSEDWVNYKFNTLVDWYQGSSFTLVARYKDSKNYVACSFSLYGRGVRLFKVINGKTYDYGQSPQLPIPAVGPWKNNNLSISVTGNHIECLRNNESVLRDDMAGIPSAGGVGLKTWNYSVNQALIGVKKIVVEAIK